MFPLGGEVGDQQAWFVSRRFAGHNIFECVITYNFGY